MSRRRVAVLGAGIMGCSVAIQLARRGFDVTVFDRETAPMAAASRWNEGKIHLGYIYGADPTRHRAAPPDRRTALRRSASRTHRRRPERSCDSGR